MPAKSALLVEDSAEVREIIREILLSENYRVKSVSDGIKAWEMVNSQSFDLVVSDLGLPGMNGDELLRNMRRKEIATPVILTAGVEMNLSAEDKDRLSNFRVVNKPFELNELKKTISELISEK